MRTRWRQGKRRARNSLRCCCRRKKPAMPRCRRGKAARLDLCKGGAAMRVPTATGSLLLLPFSIGIRATGDKSLEPVDAGSESRLAAMPASVRSARFGWHESGWRDPRAVAPSIAWRHAPDSAHARSGRPGAGGVTQSSRRRLALQRVANAARVDKRAGADVAWAPAREKLCGGSERSANPPGPLPPAPSRKGRGSLGSLRCGGGDRGVGPLVGRCRPGHDTGGHARRVFS